MARNFHTNIVINGDAKGGIQAVRMTREELNKLEKENKSVEHSQRELNHTAANSVGIFHSLRNAFVAAYALNELKDFTKSIVDANVESQRIEYTLRSVAGSTQGTAKQFAFIAKTSKSLGLDLQTAAQGYARLAVSAKSAGISQDELQKGFKGLAETFTVLHTPAQDVNGLLVQLEQGLSLGKLQMQDFRAIAQHLPGTMELAKKAAQDMGGSLQNMLAHGGVPAKQFFENFTALLHDRYGPEAKSAAHSLNAEINRLHTTLFEAETQGNSFGNSFSHAIADLTKTLNDPGVKQGFDDLISGLGDVSSFAIKSTSAIARFFSEVGSGLGIAAAHMAGYTHDPLKQLNNEIASTSQRIDSLKKKLGEIGDIRTFTPQQKQGQDARVKQLHDQIQMLQTREATFRRARESLQEGGGVIASRAPHATHTAKTHFDLGSSGTTTTHTAAHTAAKQRVSSIHQIIKALDQQRAAIGKTAEAQKIAKLQELGASQATIAHAKSIEQSINQQKALQNLFPQWQKLEQASKFKRQVSALPAQDQAFGRQRAAEMVQHTATAGLPQVKGLAPRYNGPFGEANRMQAQQQQYEKAYQQRLEAYRQFASTHKNDVATTNQAIEALNKNHEQRTLSFQRQMHQAKRKGYESLYNDMASIVGTFAGKQSRIYKDMFATEKAYDLATTLMSRSAAIGKAWGSANFPANLAAVATTIAQTSGLISDISSMTLSLSGQAHAGIDNVPTDGTWSLQGGERVVDRAANQDLTRYLERANTQNTSNTKNTQNTNISVNVQASPGVSQADAHQQGRAIAQGMRDQMRGVLIDEKRPGGILSSS